MKSLRSIFSGGHFSVQRRGHILVFLTLVLCLSSLSTLVEAQTNPLRIRKTIVGNLTTVETNQVFQYRITASCNNLTTTCGDLTLTDTLPAGVTLLGVSGPVEALPAAAAGIKYVYDDPAGPTVVIRNKRPPEVGAGDFADGEIVEFLMTVRVDSDATPGTLNNNLTGDTTQQDGGGNPPPVTIPPVPVTLLPPDPPAPNGSDWTYDKVQVIPVPPQQPTTGQPTLYQITVCPVTNIGKTPYTGMTITDTYPTGATVVDADGGAVTPPQVMWTIPDTEVAAAMENNTCIERGLLLSYDPPTFTPPMANQSNSIVVDSNECTTTCGTDTVTFNIVTPNVQVTTTKSISGSPVGEGGIGRFFLNVSPNQGNVPAPNLVLSEDINDEVNERIRVTEIQSGRWEVLDALQPYVTVRARVEYVSSAGGTTVLGTVNGATNTVWTTLPAPPAYVDLVRWVFEYDPDGAGPAPFQPGLPLGFNMLEAPEVVFTPMTNPPFVADYVPGTYQNCATATYTGGAGTSSTCIPYDLGDPGTPGTNVETSKSSPSGQTEFAPLEEFPLELRLRLSERAQVGDTIINPSIIDTLPPQLEFVSWDSVTFVNVPGGPHPLPFLRRVGSTLQWYWANAPLAGSVQPAPAGLPNTVAATGSRNFTMTANGTDQDVIVRFTVRIAPTVADNVNSPTPYTNNGYFIGPDTPICEDGTLGTEASFGIDDGDGVPEMVCQTTFGFRVRRALALEGFKWIRNPNYAATPPRFPEFAIYTDNTVPYDTSNPTTGQSCTDAINYFEYPTGSGNFWTRFPCVAFGFPESPFPTNPFTAAAPNDDQFEYLLDVRNSGNVAGQDYYLYDMLPRIGDTGSGGPLSGTPRLSRFATYLTGPVVPLPFAGVTNAGNIIIEYSQATDPCRPQVFDDPAQGACTNDWTPTFPTATPRAVTAYRIRFAANMQIAVGGRMLFRVPMVIAYDAQYGNAQIAWNSFAHTAVNAENVADGFLPPAEPRKVGIRVPERLSIGNRVWRDSDNSGTINAPDDLAPGIAGVVVNLYADFNGDGVPDGPAIRTDTTDASGYYLFDDIIPDANPNNNRYLVGIPASNFDNVGDPLYGLRSSSGPTNAYVTPPEGTTDSDDNGFDEVPYVPPSIEVLSATINLVLYSEPTTETDLSGNPADGAFSRGTRGEANFNSDLTIDFGFFGGGDSPISIGNRIFYDDGNDGAGGFNALLRNNGIQDANELGVNGVRVELYRDGNGNGQPDAAELIKFDITEAGFAGPGRPGADLNGYYLFDNLDAGTYFVVIPASEFGSGDPLGGWHSSTFNGTETVGAAGAVGTPATDLDDNGIEPTTRRPDLNGVRSGAIVLVRVNPGDPGLEVTGETDLSLEPDPGTPNSGDPLADPQTGGIFGPTVWDGPGSIGRWTLGVMTDDNSNVAVDFGFIPPMSLGNRVWLDDSSDPAQWLVGGSRNNSLIDGTDDGNLALVGLQNPGIVGVDIQLYYDENNNSVIDAGDTLVNTTTTVANGYYLFDGLAPGNYVVRIPSSEFGAGQPLNGLISSFDAAALPNPTDQIDSNDNGVDNAAPATNGIVSRQIQMVYLSEPSPQGTPPGETDIAPAGTATTLPGPQSRGRFNEADNDSDLTIDFGFVRPPLSIGNQVWLDDHPTNPALRNNAIFNGGVGGETPIAGVVVALYRDLNTNGVVDAGEDTGLRDTTDGTGFYLFDNLPPGNYIVAITEANFNTGGPLENMISSRSVAPNPVTADNQTDNNDNGRDVVVAGIGVISNSIVLTYGGEPTTETPVNTATDGPAGAGQHGERNQDSDLSIDFGFYVPMSLGNRVWLDDTNNPANWATTRNNALIDFAADDLDNPNIAGVQGLGVAGVTLRLYRDLNSNGVVDGGEDTGRTTTTNATGYYLFDGLPRGNYIVGVEASNFAAGAPLNGFYSSTNAVLPTDNDTDNTDDGIGQTANPTVPDPTFGVISPSIVLSYTNPTTGLEPLAAAEPDPSPQTQANRGANGEADAFSNLTVDFGFVRPPMSIGNQVWLDDHPTDPALRNNGRFDAGELPIQNVEVALYRDLNGNGVVDGGEDTGLRDTTDANGFYLFDNLPPGNYIVAITEANFNAGGPLENMISSRSVAPNPVAADDQTDNTDNGIDTPVVGIGIISSRINLAVNLEPIVETPTNTATDGPNGRGTHGEMDNNSDLTIDFGFYVPMSLGNRVWLDDTDNPTNLTFRNNAVLDAANDDLDNPNIAGVQGLGVAGVTLRLYIDLDADGVVDGGEDTGRTTTTNAAGYYLFDGLPRGNYIVGVEASNFAAGAPLNGFYSSSNATTPTDSDTDNTDDGIGSVANPDAPDATFGVISPSIVLSYTSPTAGNEPLAAAEPDPTPQTQANRGANGERDDFSNQTIDFGFARPPMSIGNQVWLDDHPTNQALRNNGLFDAGETPIQNVEVALYRDLNANGVVDAGEDTGLRDTTDANGFYLFSNIPAGNYIVAITAANFNAGGPLENMISSRDVTPTADNQTDNNDNGRDAFVTGIGIISDRINLTVGAEPTAETPTNTATDGPNGRGTHGELDNNSDLTVDFGFYVPMSLGNRVWLDDTDNPANWSTTRNNATLDAANDDLDNPNIAGVQGLGVAGVTLRLYRDLDADGVIDAGEDTGRTTTTNATGYYLFDGLPRGSYIVGVEASNFAAGAPLSGFYSSANPVVPTDNDTDNTDDGSGSVANPDAPDATFGVISPSIVLSYTSPTAGNEPLQGTEVDPAAQTQADRGANGEADAFSNLTIDFGFVRPPMSIGNQVWLDQHPTNPTLTNNGVVDPTEPFIQNVEVALYRDLNSNGAIDAGEDTGARDTTDANGFYLFSNLPPGDYIVAVTPINFTAGRPLFEMGSSRSIAPNPVAADNGIDNNDNGIDNPDPSSAAATNFGVISSMIHLSTTAPTEPTGETPVSTDPADGPNGRGTRGETDDHSDLTVDFGFFRPLSLGNRVWLDNGAGASYNNGIIDAGEVGIPGVRVELYRDTNGNGTLEIGTDTFVGFDTTDGGGYYLFDALTEGTYLAFIPRDNFLNIGGGDTVAGDPLANYNNSSPVGVNPSENAVDSDDVGINENFPELNGIVSVPFTLAYTTEPVGETDLSGNAADGPVGRSRGVNNEADHSSNLTVDFGFVGPVFSIGNRVWADIDNSGTVTPGDDANPAVAGDQPGFADVRVVLYRDNGNGVFSTATDTLVTAKNTDANGYYLFSNLPPGNYFVWIDQTNFRVITGVARPLFDWYSSTLQAAGDAGAGGTNTDNDDNGVNNLTPDVGGVVSAMFTLSKNDEPIQGAGANDEDNTTGTLTQGLSLNPADGPTSRGNNGELDSDSNLTVDFGFYRPLSLGNRVWFDSDSDGIIDFGSETGIAGVMLQLYRDVNGNGAVDVGTDTLVGTDTTDANGYYLFDNLPPANNYLVHIPASNFAAGGPLVGRFSTLDNVGGVADIDSNDNGIGDSTGNPAVNGVTSNVIDLVVSYTNAPAPQQQPTNEADLSGNAANDGPNSRGRFGETNGNSDLTIDFGFVGTLMSLGNRVWFDGNNSATIDPTDDFVAGGAIVPGIPGVTVQLFLDANTDGIPDSSIPVVPNVVTDANGYYLFQNLQPGNYVVALSNSNFTTGQPLNGLISSTGNAGDTQIDSDDNGIDLLNVTFGLLSPTINLALNSEPVAGVETDVPAIGNGPGVNDNNGELTVDFGLYRPMSLGNRLWFDTDADSTQDAGESGVPAGVTIGLYRDDNNDGTPDGPSIATTTTDANGYYLFDGLGSGRYIVIVEQANFQPGGPLEAYTSSPGEDTSNNVDRNDNGRNNPTPATGGISSNTITLTINGAPTNDETDLSGNTVLDGPNSRGLNGETNNNSNLTVDFGFVTSTRLSLGNLVWLDNGGTGSGTARDGIRNGDEAPFVGVRVNLYRDTDANGIPDDIGVPGPTGDIIATDTTDVNGHYLFDNLAPGNYIVELAASNFAAGAVLDGYGSTTTQPIDTNNQDNGVDTADTIQGIRSSTSGQIRTITLSVGGEPTADTDAVNTKGYGAGGVDANGNMTVDFGLYRPMSIGNRVWFDTDANGLINGTENGIAGVTVELRADTNGNGIFEPATDLLVTTPGVTATDVTDSLGYYLFGNLAPGTYFVYIPPSQFTAGGVLNGFASTIDNVGSVPADSNDNGVSDGGTGIVSNLITLVENGAPTTETDLSGDATADGPRFIGRNGENNRNSDVTIDFGFTSTPMSLGNRVWLDNGAGGGVADNGLIDGTEAGIANVRVNLYADTNSDGVPDGGIIRTDTTDANGYYLFDNLPPGSYLVQIAASNFNTGGPLRGLFSSTGSTGDNQTDSNDNGLDALNPSINGIISNTIVLAPTTEPVGENDPAPQTQADRGGNGETDDNSDLTIDFGFSTRSDWGDAPDSYGTNNVAGDSGTDPVGPSHVIVANLFMGNIVDNETNGQPNATADGDDTAGVGGDDEDGLTIPTIVAGTNLNVEVTVFNNTGAPATLVGWVDLNGNGTFEPTEAATVTVPSSATSQTVTLTFAVPATADIDTGGQTYARFRLTTDATITTSTPGGPASDGEIEDYVVPVNPPGVSVTKTDGQNSIVVGQSTTYTITIQYSGLTGITRPVNDTTNPPNAFVPSSLSWTCDANAQASCITGMPNGTDIATDTDAATPPVAGLITGQSIDLDQGGQLIYTVTGTLRPDYADVFPGIPNVDNTVTLNVGETATDSNGVIFDPPFGVKTGTAIGANTIRWTMIWFNTGAPQAASITDVLDPGQTNPTNLVCTPFGSTTTNLCEVQNGDTVFWDGTLGDGTTPTSRNDNRLQITFDVTVAGPATYNNLATITTPGGDTSTAAGVVRIPGPDEPEGQPESGEPGLVDPTIAKLVDPIFSSPGETVLWTIMVINPHNQAITNVTASDNIPADLEILSTSTSNGSVAVNGQLVTVTIPTLNALETVLVTVRTRINKNTKASEFINYADVFTPEKGKIQTAEAVLTMVRELPQTGETPIQWSLIRALVLVLVVGSVGLVVYRRRMIQPER